MSKTKHKVGQVESLDEEPRCVEIDEKKFLVYKNGDDVYGYRNVCPHQQGPVVEGEIDEENGTVICPWHGWEFDLDGGKNLFETGAGDQLPQVKTIVEGGDVYIVH